MIQRLRVPLGFVIAVLVLYLAQPSALLILLGLPIALAGAALRALAAGVIRKDATLTTSGPYAWTRNPLYLGSFLLGLGFAVMSGNWLAAALIVLPSFVIYPNVIRNEEAHLARLFPDQFPEYCANRSKVLSALSARPGQFFDEAICREPGVPDGDGVCGDAGGVHREVAERELGGRTTQCTRRKIADWVSGSFDSYI